MKTVFYSRLSSQRHIRDPESLYEKIRIFTEVGPENDIRIGSFISGGDHRDRHTYYSFLNFYDDILFNFKNFEDGLEKAICEHHSTSGGILDFSFYEGRILEILQILHDMSENNGDV